VKTLRAALSGFVRKVEFPSFSGNPRRFFEIGARLIRIANCTIRQSPIVIGIGPLIAVGGIQPDRLGEVADSVVVLLYVRVGLGAVGISLT
jgi:hypothetical protein